MKSLSAMSSRLPARLPLATVKALVPVAVAASLLMASGLVQAAAPTAGFDWSPTVPAIGQTVTFNSSTADDDGDAIDSIVWDFGGGATDSGANVQHAFASPGQKSVTMTVTDSANESTVVTHPLRVNAPPSASFTVSPSPVSANQSVSLDASGTTDDAAIANSSYEWDLDNDGQYDDATGQQLTQSFSTPGLKVIGLRVTDSENESDTASRSVTVVALNSPPQAAFGFSPTRPNVGQTVSFDATTSTDDQPIPATGYDWDLDNDGQYDDATGPTPTTSFPTPGSRTVGLRVTDSNGVRDSTSHPLIVNAPPSAAFSFTPQSPVTGQVVSFNGSASSDDLSLAEGAFDWDLDGDGQYGDAAGRQPSKIYSTAGTRTVRLRVTDSGGVSDVTTASVSVTQANTPPQPAFTISPASPDVGDQVSMNAATTTDDKTLPASAYAWDLDGDTQYDDATGLTPTTAFATSGAKPIGLQVTDSDGVAVAVSHSVTVLANATPVARATFTPARPNPGATVTFNASTSTDDDPIPANAYTWDFDGDGQYDDGTGVSPTTSFATPGAKSVGLRVTDADTAAGSTIVSVPVNRAPSANFGFNPQTPRVGESVTFTSAAGDDVALPTTAGTISWDLDNDGQFDDGSAATATRAYTSAGDQTVRMRVQDAGGLVTIGSRTFPVQQFQPTASFTSSPAHPLPGQTVTFRSTSTPSQGSQITSQEWDLDGISGIDATGPVVTTIYRTAGRRTVTLTVRDSQGYDITTAPVAVNAPPIAAFRVSPTQPYVGDQVSLVSVSSDPDGPVSSEAWDLDGDGQYDDATGKTTSKSFTTAGAHTVRLRVVDSAGAAGSAAVTMNVQTRPVPPVTKLPQLNARVRVNAQRGKSSTRILTLGVRAPRGAVVKVKCIGRGCPRRRASSTRSKGKALRMHWLEHRLRAGTRITISVTRSGYIGSYTSLLVRRSKGVSRDDLCLLPSRKKPGRCPS